MHTEHTHMQIHTDAQEGEETGFDEGETDLTELTGRQTESEVVTQGSSIPEEAA